MESEARTELTRLRRVFTDKEREMREAVSQVETLRKQLDDLHRRRLSAKAAAAQVAASVKAAEKRPKAAVGPFQVNSRILIPRSLLDVAQ